MGIEEKKLLNELEDLAEKNVCGYSIIICVYMCFYVCGDMCV